MTDPDHTRTRYAAPIPPEHPCCADCAEYNAQGCPGNSPYCSDARKLRYDLDKLHALQFNLMSTGQVPWGTYDS